jgi:hypothetical protein
MTYYGNGEYSNSKYTYKTNEEKVKEKIDEFIKSQESGAVRWTEQAYLKSKYYVENNEDEVYWLYLGEEVDDVIVLQDCVLIEQVVSSASCELDMKKLGDWMEANPELIPKVVGWGHSHNTMDKFFSTTDEDDIERATNSKRWVSIVFNKPFSYLARIDVPSAFGKLPVENIQIGWEVEDDDDLKKECVEEIKHKVKKEKWGGNKKYKNEFITTSYDDIDGICAGPWYMDTKTGEWRQWTGQTKQNLRDFND